jgi:hypothetical protein
MTFPDAKLYPQGKNPGMTMEDNGKKCDTVEGAFTDDILQSAQNASSLNTNPVTSFDIRFAIQCNGETQAIHGRVVLSQ